MEFQRTVSDSPPSSDAEHRATVCATSRASASARVRRTRLRPILVEHRNGNLEGQSRLAKAAHPRQGHKPRPRTRTRRFALRPMNAYLQRPSCSARLANGRNRGAAVDARSATPTRCAMSRSRTVPVQQRDVSRKPSTRCDDLWRVPTPRDAHVRRAVDGSAEKSPSLLDHTGMEPQRTLAERLGHVRVGEREAVDRSNDGLQG